MAYPLTLPTFNPYVSVTPVEDVIKISMMKQQKYDENVQRIQQWVDQTAALPVLRPHDAQIIQSKLNGFGATISKMGAADFSQQQVMNSVAGMTSTISRDRDIVNGVASYYNNKANVELMDKQRQEGKLTPQNELQYQKRLNEYMQSTDSRVFSYKYESYFDHYKFQREQFDAVSPDNRKLSDFFQLDGSTGMLKFDAQGRPLPSVRAVKEFSGYEIERAQAILAGIMQDPRVQRQVQIDGEYMKQGLSPEDLSKSIKSIRSSAETIHNNKLQALRAAKAAGKATDADITNEEDSWKNSLSNYDSLEKMSFSNPDAVRGLLHKEEYRHNVIDKYGERVKSISLEKNPFWEMSWDMYKEQNAENHRAWEKETKRLELLLKQRELAGSGSILYAQPSGIEGVMAWNSRYKASLDRFTADTDQFLIATALSDKRAEMQSLINRGLSEEEAAAQIVKAAAEAAGYAGDDKGIAKFRADKSQELRTLVGSMKPQDLEKNQALNLAYKTFLKSQSDFNIKQNEKKKFQGMMPAGVDNLDFEGVEDVTVRDMQGNPIQVTKENLVDLGLVLYHKSSPFEVFNTDQTKASASEAEKRLKQQGKGFLVDAMLTARGQSGAVWKDVARKMFPDFPKILGGNATNLMLGPDSQKFLSAIDKVYQKIDNEGFQTALNIKSKIIQQNINLQPNLAFNVLTGKKEVDEGKLMTIKNILSTYGALNQNLAPDFDYNKISTYINNDKDVKSIKLVTKVDHYTGQSQPYLVFDEGGSNESSAAISTEEANFISPGILNNLYEDEAITGLRSLIGRSGSTSSGDALDLKTYTNNQEAFMTKMDFPKLQGTNYDVQANVIRQSGFLIPVLYVSDGQRPPVLRQLPPKSDAAEVYSGLQNIDLTFIQAVLKEEYGKQ